MFNFFKKKPDITETIQNAVSEALRAEREVQAKAEQEEKDRLEASKTKTRPEDMKEAEEVERDESEPVLVVEMRMQLNKEGAVEVVYNFDHNAKAIHEIDRYYAGTPFWKKARLDQEKVVLFMYDSVTSLAEPYLPDNTVTELDLFRESVLGPAPVNQPFVTDEIDIRRGPVHRDGSPMRKS